MLGKRPDHWKTCQLPAKVTALICELVNVVGGTSEDLFENLLRSAFLPNGNMFIKTAMKPPSVMIVLSWEKKIGGFVFLRFLRFGFSASLSLMVSHDCHFKKCFCCYCSILIFHFVLTKSKPAQLDTSWFWFVLILRECLKWHKRWGKYFKPWWLQHWSSRRKHQKDSLKDRPKTFKPIILYICVFILL